MMKQKAAIAGTLTLLLIASGVLFLAKLPGTCVSVPRGPQERFGRIPLAFEAKTGPPHAAAEFVSRAPGFVLYLRPDETILRLAPSRPRRTSAAGSTAANSAKNRGAAVRIKLVGSNPATALTGAAELPWKSNYFVGNDPQQWRTGVVNYSRVEYHGIYPGVDLVYYGTEAGQLEHDFIVAPGVDPHVIQLAFERVDDGDGMGLQLADNGDLVLSLEGGDVRLEAPNIYQRGPDGVSKIKGHYVIRSDSGMGGFAPRRFVVGFSVAAYDTARPLVIDPVLSYSTYVGGNDGMDQGHAIAVDSAGNAYVAGYSFSTDLPATGRFQDKMAGFGDAFVCKLNPTGSAYVYITYLGGNASDGFGRGNDDAHGIAVDSQGHAYVTGVTWSNNFPIVNAYQSRYGGNGDVFLSRLNATGTALVFSTFLGGGSADSGEAVAIDASGDAYVTGWTESTDFPNANAPQTRPGGDRDAFITKVRSTGRTMAYSTYLGGSGADEAHAIVQFANGNVSVTGQTSSTNFPITSGAIQPQRTGLTKDAFFVELSSSGTFFVASTYLGGAGEDSGWAIAVDSQFNRYVAGETASSDFPQAVTGYDRTYNQGGDAFVVKISSSGTRMLYSTFLGGSGRDTARGIAVDATGSVYVSGTTFSIDFPTVNEIQRFQGGEGDVFVSKLNPAGTALLYSTYVGGSKLDGISPGGDEAMGIALTGGALAVDTAGSAYVTGATLSANWPKAGTPVKSNLPAGDQDAFVLKIVDTPAPAAQITLNPTSISLQGLPGDINPATKPVTVTNSGTGSMAWRAETTTNPSGNWLSVIPTNGTLNAGQTTTLTVSAASRTLSAGGYSGALVVTSADAANSPQQAPVSLLVACPATAVPGLRNEQTPGCTDELTLSAPSPDPFLAVAANTDQIFSASVAYQLQSRSTADLQLRALDQNGNILEISSTPTVRSSDGARTVNLQVARFRVPAAATRIRLEAILFSAAPIGVFKRSNTVDYAVLSGTDSIAIVNPRLNGQPAPDGSVAGPAGGTVQFTADIDYTLASDPAGGILSLQAVDTSGVTPQPLGLPRTLLINPTSQKTTARDLSVTFGLPDSATSLRLQAALVSSKGAVLKTQTVNYTVKGNRIRLSFSADRNVTSLGRSAGIDYGTAGIEAFYDLTAVPQGELDLIVDSKKRNGDILESYRSNPQQVQGGLDKRHTFLLPHLEFRDSQDLVEFRARMSWLGQEVISDPITIRINRIRHYSNTTSTPKIIAQPLLNTTLRRGQIESFRLPVEYSTNDIVEGTPTSWKIEVNLHYELTTGETVDVRPLSVNVGSNQSAIQTLTFFDTIPTEAKRLKVSCILIPDVGGSGLWSSARERVYNRFGAPDNVLSTTLGGVAVGARDVLGVDLFPVANQVQRAVNIVRDVQDARGVMNTLNLKLQRLESTDGPPLLAQSQVADFIGIYATWQFDPPIPSGSGNQAFIADLTLHYTAADLPDDPNFRESEMRIVSFDPATGSFESLPTVLNTTQKTAATRINGLRPYYGLGVFGPFGNRSLNFPLLRNSGGVFTGLAHVNLGASGVTLTPRAFSSSGKEYPPRVNPATIVLGPGQQSARLVDELFELPLTMGNGWVQVRSTSTAVSGFQLAGAATTLDGVDVPATRGTALVLTDVEWNNQYATEFNIVNPASTAIAVNLELFSAGVLVATHEETLPAKGKFVSNIQQLFPSLARPFLGYVRLQADTDVAAAVLLVSQNAVAALNGQVLKPGAQTPSKLYSAQLATGAGLYYTRVTLVNPTALAATVQLRAVRETGINLAAPVSMSLGPGQQLQRDLGTLFGLDPGVLTVGSLIVESSITGILGDISFGDPTAANDYRSSLPLDAEPIRAAAFAHVANGAGYFTGFAAFNPNAAAASLLLRVFRADGSLTGSRSIVLQANGRTSQLLPQIVPASEGQIGGYFTIESDQPVSGFALFGTTSLDALSAIPALPKEAGATGSASTTTTTGGTTTTTSTRASTSTTTSTLPSTSTSTRASTSTTTSTLPSTSTSTRASTSTTTSTLPSTSTSSTTMTTVVSAGCGLFSDNFNDGNADDWILTGGTWQVSGARLQVSAIGADRAAAEHPLPVPNYFRLSMDLEAVGFSGAVYGFVVSSFTQFFTLQTPSGVIAASGLGVGINAAGQVGFLTAGDYTLINPASYGAVQSVGLQWTASGVALLVNGSVRQSLSLPLPVVQMENLALMVKGSATRVAFDNICQGAPQ